MNLTILCYLLLIYAVKTPIKVTVSHSNFLPPFIHVHCRAKSHHKLCFYFNSTIIDLYGKITWEKLSFRRKSGLYLKLSLNVNSIVISTDWVTCSPQSLYSSYNIWRKFSSTCSSYGGMTTCLTFQREQNSQSFNGFFF